jgi:hypothetical protein
LAELTDRGWLGRRLSSKHSLKEGTVLRRALHFGIGTGTLATACMSLVLLGLRSGRTHRGKHPPEKVTEGIIERISGRKLNDRERLLATATAHEGYGIAAASVFALLWERFGPRRKWPVIHGMLFSLGLWFVSYKGWVPGLKLMPSPKRDRRGGVATNIASHLAYGAVLGANARKLEARRAW